VSAGLRVVVTEPVMGRFASVLTEGTAADHEWIHVTNGDPRLPELAAGADVLVCSTVTPELLAAMPRLRLLQVSGAGYDKIPLQALPDDVRLANTFHHGRSIAEHVMMVSMMLLRGALRSDREMRAGVWSNVMVTPDYPFGGVLAGRTLGVVGFGEIGSSVARLGSAMGMAVRAVRRNPAAALPADVDVEWVGGDADLHELLGASDVVVVTVPLSEATRGLIDVSALAAMKPTAVLVNVARGAVVDEKALHSALTTGSIAGAGIDVWWRNPRDPDAPPPAHLDFTSLPNVVLTPHQSGHTEEVFAGRARDIRHNVEALAAGRPLRNLVRR
jgi:phosphoglycerate dehydrogenase-like enzyme